MAEVKNSFLSSKMNKDLDDRLIPSNEYRDALNITIGKSESSDIGTAQNILGNVALNNFDEDSEDFGLTCIGILMDDQNNRIYQFLTNYTDPNPSGITLCETVNPPPANGWIMKITVYDYNVTPQYKTIVQGTFLNFSTTNHIIGVNLIENLLFFTDNRNQPRKINVSTAILDPTYYYDESQISVAKYAPVEPISLFKKATGIVASGSDTSYVITPQTGRIKVGMTLISNTVDGSDYAYIMDTDGSNIELYQSVTLTPGQTVTFLESTMTNQTDNPSWPGDPSFLEDKYVRFSYRFKFDDNEYSLFAPFTQIAYIPKQKGYFINGNETAAYKSTVISWMENNINNIELLIPMPDKGSNIRNSYKITQLDILYKESDSLAVKVLDSISYEDIQTGIYAGTNIYNYPYQSQKPYKTLPEDQLTRVYDNVPTRALAQEVVGNRVIYGNFYNAYTAPQNINYNTAVQPKSDIFTNFVEYPNHTLKQNRNYQVGFILSDKFGRQSSVILSTVDLTTTTSGSTNFGGSTVYAPYESKDMPGMPDVRDWFGNALLILVNDPINSTRNIPVGTPGLYAESTSPGGFSIVAGATANVLNTSTGLYEYTFNLNTASGIINTVPVVGNSLRGKYKDYVNVITKTGTGSGPYVISTDGEINDIYRFDASLSPVPNTKFTYSINEIGWYSYKVVVKQQQQEYYNVYLPGMLDGYPSDQTYGSQVIYTGSGSTAESTLENGINMTEFPVGEIGKTGHIVLINDNINKVPRDLVEVGPDQKLYRSSVQLFGKVSNTAKKLNVVAYGPSIIDDLYATSIKYEIAANTDVLQNVRIGDGIQSVEANKPVENLPTYPGTYIPNPDEWMANTVVTSNTLFTYEAYSVGVTAPLATTITIDVPHTEVSVGDKFIYEVSGTTYDAEVGAIDVTNNIITFLAGTEPTVSIPSSTLLSFTNTDYGVITFTPSNITRAAGSTVYSPYINYTITSAESTQYYPTRQPDTVTAIATASDYNFLANGVTNIKGTAGLNFYQLQSNPSVGRVSTINPIGVPSLDMIPFLGVYETRPTDSLLALFWETASTGYISDLNWDVLTGYDGPTRFSDLGFRFFENQDPLGTDLDPNATGNADCPFITDEFYIENNTGFTIMPISTPYLFEVKDGNGVPYTSSFSLVEVTPGLYRVKITPSSNFVFDRGAITTNTNSVFNFTVRVEWGVPGQFADLYFSGRLGNIAPTFLHDYPYYNAFTTQTVTTGVTTVTAVNGTHGSLNQKDLYFDILTGNSGGWFYMDPATGRIDLTDATIPLGVYDLDVRVRDAVIPPAPGNPLVGTGVFQTLSDTIIVRITVGPKPVNDRLQYFESPWVWENYDNEDCAAITPPQSFPGQGYGAIHVGVDDLALDPITHINNGLPDITLTNPAAPSKAFQNYSNIQIANGILPPPFGNPTGLTEGALEWQIFVAGSGVDLGSRTGSTQFVLYYRPLMARPNTNTWQAVLDENGILFPASTTWSAGIEVILPSTPSTTPTDLRISFPVGSSYADSAALSTKFVTSIPGEYCLVLKSEFNEFKTGPQTCGPQIYSYAIVKDANYEYIEDGEPVTSPPFPPPSTIPVEYYVSFGEEWNGDYPSGVPYDTQDATVGFAFSTTATLFAATPADPAPGSNKIQLTTLDPQLVPGVYVNAVGYLNTNTQITNVDSATNTLTLSIAAFTEIPAGTVISFNAKDTFPAKRGSVWASTNNGLHVNQFYVDSALTQAWVPPIADKFYIYQNKNLNYVTGDPSAITNKPYFCAKIDSNGGVTPIVSPGNTVTTAWKRTTPASLTNHGRNLFFASSSV
jgi:hypothetical protein